MSDLAWVSNLLISAVIGRVLWTFLKERLERRKYPYQFSCPKCSFVVKATNKEFIVMNMERHHHE